MRVGDIVARRSYACDVCFRITGGDSSVFTLQGVNYRLCVDADADDLVPVTVGNVRELRRFFNTEASKRVKSILDQRSGAQITCPEGMTCMPGKVLHVDGDGEYMRLCLDTYRKLAVPAYGEVVQESRQAARISDMLHAYSPDILIITGHDSLADTRDRNSLTRYRSSNYFVDAVRAARKFQSSKDALVIVAGACQSYYEALIEAGANVASSPERVLIHALDPLFVAERIAWTPIGDILGIEEMLENTITGCNGYGGFQTRGVMRTGFPKAPR